MTFFSILLRFATLALVLLGPVAVSAQEPASASPSGPAREARFGDDNIAVELISRGSPRPGTVWTLALRFTPSGPQWHGYWDNPGDAGQPMALTLDLPEGWEVGQPIYPVPRRLKIGGLMNHIYEGEYSVLVPVSVPANATIPRTPMTGFVEYLACTDSICVPQDARIVARDGGSGFDRIAAGATPLLDRQGRFSLSGRHLDIALDLPASLAIERPHVFMRTRDLVDYSAVQTFFRHGDRLVARLPLKDGDATAAVDAVSGIIAYGEGQGLRFTAVPGNVPTGGEPVVAASAEQPGLPFGWALAGAFVGGVLLNILPCVFPILSLKALALVKAGTGERAARRDAVAYTAGAVLACIGLGAALLALRAGGESVGWAFQLQEPWVVAALFVLTCAITANLAGAFDLPGPALRGEGRISGSFGTGLLAAFVATPCTGPFMAAALGAALLLPAAQAVALFAALGLGLALPFLAIGFVPALRRRLPAPGAWMERFRRWMALPMAATALALGWLAWRVGGLSFLLAAIVIAVVAVLLLSAFLGGLKSGNARWAAAGVATFLLLGSALGVRYAPILPAASANDSLLAPVPFSEAALQEARGTGRPVFVWFTADWCVTCKVNEAAAIEREATAAAFEEAGVIALRGDWTRRDEAIGAFLFARGAAGVPLYLWYPAGGEARQLPQILTQRMLVERANGIR